MDPIPEEVSIGVSRTPAPFRHGVLTSVNPYSSGSVIAACISSKTSILTTPGACTVRAAYRASLNELLKSVAVHGAGVASPSGVRT
jgi:hypothetical protein